MDKVFFYQSVLEGEVKGFTDHREAFMYTLDKMCSGTTDATLYKMRFDIQTAEKIVSPA